MQTIPKILILSGVFLIAAGLWWHFLGDKLPLGKLPGDIHITSGKTNIYIPITSCLLVSALLSLISYLLKK